MYSTLNNQENLIQVSAYKKFLLRVILSWISPRSKFYIMVRNPFDRIVSFYKDKFLNAEHLRLWMIQNDKGKWQECTEHFFPYLDLNMQTDPMVVSKKLMSTKFEKVISILPYVFMRDEHMWPQYHAQKISFSKFGIPLTIPIRFEKIFRIEIKEDLQEFSKIFNLDLTIKINNTKKINGDINWNIHLIEIIEGLYEKDFKYFEYEKKSKK